MFEFTRKESCGKCFPCRLGSARGLEPALRGCLGEEKLTASCLMISWIRCSLVRSAPWEEDCLCR
ncbi:MAG: hypothetical protein H6545_02400 [Bacteroidales bacterium]|nr:hypothetical protein [Bacteroidales bacterium]